MNAVADPVVLIHGAWQGSWAFGRLVPRLEAAGLEVHAVDLPGNGRDGLDPRKVTSAHYLDHLEGLLLRIGRPVSLIGHSGGGAVVSLVAEALVERVRRVGFIAGMMLPPGMGFAEIQAATARDAAGAHGEPDGVTPHLVWSACGRMSTVPPAVARRYFFDDCEPADAAEASACLTPQGEGGRALRPATTPARFGRLPRLYVEATRDRSVPLAAQRRMQALSPGAEIVSLPTGHVPQLSAPDRLAQALLPFLLAHPVSPTRQTETFPTDGEPACPSCPR